MRSPFLTRRPERSLAVGRVGVVVGLLAGCGGAASATSSGPDRIIAGPQGQVGQFVVECRLSHRLADDPIVRPGKPGSSHLHQFFGSVVVDATTTYREMRASGTSCDQQADTAAYWTPVLLDSNGDPVEPIRAVAYYRAGPDIEPTSVVAYPPDLMMVAGNPHATEEQSLGVVAWACGTGSERTALPRDCTAGGSLRLLVTFPDCWNGVDTTSPHASDPAASHPVASHVVASHVVYSTDGECPDTHPVSIPQLQLAIDFLPVAPHGLTFSSGGILGGHADFWNAWDPDKLRNEVVRCLQRDLVCGVSG